MTDFSASQRDRLIRFVNQDLMGNAGGIGNECTHLIYAALFEARALDGVTDKSAAFPISQSVVPYTWGRKLGKVTEGKAGDIVQYHDFTNVMKFYRYTKAADDQQEPSFIRGPHHTAVLWAVGDGYILEAESHLTHPRIATMKTRLGIVFTVDFSIIVNEREYRGDADVKAFVDGFPWSSKDQVGEYLAGAGMFGTAYTALYKFKATAAEDKKFLTDKKAYDAALAKGKTIALDVRGSPVFFAWRHTRTTGANALNVFTPQDSARRRGMTTNAELAEEKNKVSAAMVRGGRAGASEHGDSKEDRKAAGGYYWQSLP